MGADCLGTAQILGNLVICQVVTLARIAKVVFLGTLRDIEVEVKAKGSADFLNIMGRFLISFCWLSFFSFQVLFENTKHALMDTCLALALFRAEISPSVLAMFGGLLFCKIFHWLSKSRLEHVRCLVCDVGSCEEVSGKLTLSAPFGPSSTDRSSKWRTSRGGSTPAS